ncbi:ABC transporter B family member 5 [Spatholobus suberectus]|nr:ABC transporter B family member 5 [Spatholobus suberectus]
MVHKLSTIKGADLIAVVKNEIIAKKGKHEALPNKGVELVSELVVGGWELLEALQGYAREIAAARLER